MSPEPRSTPFPGRFRLLDAAGSQAEAGDATFEPGSDALLIYPKQGAQLRVDFADVDRLRAADYAVELALEGGDRIEASMLGRRFGEFSETLGGALRAYQSKNLLLDEPVGGEQFPGEIAWQGETGPAELRVHATRLAVLPRDRTPFAVPFGEVRAIAFDEARYAIDLKTADGTLSLLKLGKRTHPCLRLLESRLAELQARTSAALASLVPGLPTLAARKLAQALPDGMPANRAALDAVGPRVWTQLLESAVAPALRESFEELSGLCPAGEAAVAIKETNARQDGEPAAEEELQEQAAAAEEPLEEPAEAETEAAEEGSAPGSMAGRVVWYLFPIYSDDRRRPGNAVAVEVATREGRATYFFRIAPPEVYRGATPEQLRELARERIGSISRALVSLGFKREPIYLPEEKIRAGKWARYRLALRLSPALKAARATFVGRAAHGAAWKRQLDEALAKANPQKA